MIIWSVYFSVWCYSRSEEDQNRNIAKLNSLRDQNKLDELDVQVAEHVKSISIYQFLGEDRLQYEKRINSAQPYEGKPLHDIIRGVHELFPTSRCHFG